MISILLLVACAPDVAGACQRYFDALGACYADYDEANGIDMSGERLSDSYCADTFADTHDEETAAYLDCLAAAYAAADCTAVDAYTDVDLTACVEP